MTSALAAYGVVLKAGDGATNEAFTAIAEVRDIDGPEIEAEMKEVTSHDSGGWREFIPTLLGAGEVSFDLNFIPTNGTHDHTTGLVADLVGRTKRNYQLVWPDNEGWQFAAYVSGFSPSAPVEDELSAEVTLTVTGAISYLP